MRGRPCSGEAALTAVRPSAAPPPGLCSGRNLRAPAGQRLRARGGGGRVLTPGAWGAPQEAPCPGRASGSVWALRAERPGRPGEAIFAELAGPLRARGPLQSLPKASARGALSQRLEDGVGAAPACAPAGALLSITAIGTDPAAPSS